MAHGEALPAFDLHTPLLSLPWVLGLTLEAVPSGAYLWPDAALAADWRSRLAIATGLRVGLAWAGSHTVANAAIDRRRSVPPAHLAPLFQVPGISFVSLQKDGPPMPAEFPLIDPMPAVRDFADTAAIIANLDLVITVDTAVAHLAAAFGKPVWMLNRFDSCWRWFTGRRDSPWYPSMRIYRQPAPGDWESVIAELARDLSRQRD